VEGDPIEGAQAEKEEVGQVEIIPDIVHDETTASPTKGLKKFLMSRVSISETSADELRNSPNASPMKTASPQRKSTSRHSQQPLVDIADMSIESRKVQGILDISHNASQVFGATPNKNATPNSRKSIVEYMDVDETFFGERLSVETLKPSLLTHSPSIEESKDGNSRNLVTDENSPTKSNKFQFGSAQKTLINSAERKKTLVVENIIEDEQLVLIDVVEVEVPAKRKSLNKSQSADDIEEEIALAKSPDKRKSLNKSTIPDDDIARSSNSPARRKSLNKSKTTDDFEEQITKLINSPNKRKSLNKSIIPDDDMARTSNSQIEPEESPARRKSLNKSKTTDEEEIMLAKSPSKCKSLNKSSIPDDDMAFTSNSNAKSPANRKSLNKSKATDDFEEEITLANSPDKRKSINKSTTPDDDMAFTSNSNAKSPANRKSLNKSKATDDFEEEITLAKSPEKRKSINKSTIPDDDDIIPKTGFSWNQSVRSSSSHAIDNLKIAENEVIRDKSKRSKIISSDESEDEQNENHSFHDDEAEVASDEDSLTPSERQYLEENEFVEDGEILGSEDSECDGDDEGEEEEDEDDSFIDKDEDISNQYSMDSDEELIEMKKRKRIIVQSSSSEDESEKTVPSEVPSRKSLNKSQIRAESPEKIELAENGNNSEDENEAEVPKNISIKRKSLNKSSVADEQSKQERKSMDSCIKEHVEECIFSLETPIASASKIKKRKRETFNESTTTTPKRAKLMTANESEAMHMEDNSHLVVDDENFAEEIENVERPAKTQSREIDISGIFQRVNQHMEEFNANKKAQAAQKKEKKAQKLAKKQQEAANEPNADSLDGNNKENASKKKKKNKSKTQKHINGKS
jgi:hypothetical protein